MPAVCLDRLAADERFATHPNRPDHHTKRKRVIDHHLGGLLLVLLLAVCGDSDLEPGVPESDKALARFGERRPRPCAARVGNDDHFLNTLPRLSVPLRADAGGDTPVWSTAGLRAQNSERET